MLLLLMLTLSLQCAEASIRLSPWANFAFALRNDITADLSGGLRREAEYMGLSYLRLELGKEKEEQGRGLHSWISAIAYFGGQASHGVGNLMEASNIEAPASTIRLYELWVEQPIAGGKIRIEGALLHDLNTEFYQTVSSGFFLNSAFGTGEELAQTGVNGPSIYPFTAPAILLKVLPTDFILFKQGIYNARAGDPEQPRGTHIRLNASDGLLLISELDYLPIRAKYALGVWTYTHEFPVLDEAGGEDVSHGAYLLATRDLLRGVSGFLRYGVASSRVNRLDSCLGLGLVFEGVFQEFDRLGFGLLRAANGEEFLAQSAKAGRPQNDAETIFELTHQFVFHDLLVQPDLQYVINPNTSPGIPNAVVGTIRLELDL